MKFHSDEHFFDEFSKPVYYLYGAFMGGYRPQGISDIKFRAEDVSLIAIVKKYLDSYHQVIKDNSGVNSHFLQIKSVPHLRNRLEELGLTASLEERRFPEIKDETDLSHFVRGFADRKYTIGVQKGGTNWLRFRFNPEFILALHNVFAKYAGVQSAPPTGRLLAYGHFDALKVHDFIYKDWEFIEQNKLYVPELKSSFKTHVKESKCRKKSMELARKRMDVARELLKKGRSGAEVARTLGYTEHANFHRIFKKVTGLTPMNYAISIRE